MSTRQALKTLAFMLLVVLPLSGCEMVPGEGDDTAPPTSPGNLQAAVINATQIDLSWNASTDDTGVAGYKVYRGGVYHDSAAETSYSDTGLNSDTAYCYTVSAFDAAGNKSAQSPEVCTTTLYLDITPPTITIDTVTTPINIADQTITGTVESGATVTVTVDTTATAGTVNYPTTTTWSCAITGLVKGVNNITATATDTAGNLGYAEVTFTVDITSPTGSITINSGDTYTDSTSVTLTLSASDTNGVAEMQFSDDNVNWSTPEAYATSKAWTLPTGDGTKTVHAEFKDNAGNWSTVYSDTIILDATPPTAPILNATAISDTQINLSWTESTDIGSGLAGYDVYRNPDYTTPIGTTTVTSFSDTELTAETQYCYKVAAVDAVGWKTLSTLECATTLAAPDITAPTVPANLIANAVSSSQIDLAWDASTDDVAVTGYNIYNGTGGLIGTSTATNYSDTGLTDNTQYCYTVSAYDATGNESVQSTQECATTLTAISVVPYVSDVNTVLLDHFDGSTSASILAYEQTRQACGNPLPAATPSYSFGPGPDGLTQSLTLNPPEGVPAGSATYLQYPGGQLLSQSNGTIEFWVYLTSWGVGLVNQGKFYGSCAGWTFKIGVSATGQLRSSAWAAFHMDSGTATVPLNSWTHVAATWGSAGAKLYINGVQVGSDTNTGMPASGYGGSLLLRLGTHTSSVSIDELRVSNIQRTTFTVFTVTQPILDFDLTQGSGTTMVDSANGIVGTTSGTVWSTDPSGEPVLYFDNSITYTFGTGDYMEIPYHDALNSPHLSIEIWVYPMSTGYYTVFAERIKDGGTYKTITSIGFAATGYTTGTQPVFNLTFGGVGKRVVSPTEITLNAWHHIVGTYDGNDMTLYVDGELVATEFGVGGPRDTGSNHFYIGHAPSSNHYYKGYYARFKRYDTALSADEVAYNFGLSWE